MVSNIGDEEINTTDCGCIRIPTIEFSRHSIALSVERSLEIEQFRTSILEVSKLIISQLHIKASRVRFESASNLAQEQYPSQTQ